MRKLRSKISLVVVLVMILGLAGAAFLHRGVPAADVEMNDGGVWVTNPQLKLVAHLNYPSRTLDGGVRTATSAFDITQAANDIVLLDSSGATAQIIDPSSLTLSPAAPLTNRLAFSQGGSIGVIVDAKAGKVWALNVKELGSFAASSKPLVEDKPNITATATATGGILTVDQDGVVTSYTSSGKDWISKEAGTIKDLPAPQARTVTAVGDELIILDSAAGVVYTTHGQTKVAPKSVLQQPGATSDDVIVAGPSELIAVPIQGGKLTSVPARIPGAPAAPVHVGDCAYGVWAGSGAYVRMCGNTDDNKSMKVDKLAKDASKPMFRVNRDVVVINDLSNGNVFLVNDEMRMVSNWDDINTQVHTQEDQTKTSTESLDTNASPARNEKNSAPKANPDDFGVRPGRSTVLPLVANDTDPDGDILTVASMSKPSMGSVSIARNGEAVSFTAPGGGSGSTAFTYVVSDGRGGTDSTTVNVTIRSMDQNLPPKQFRSNVVPVAQGSTTKYNVLPEWIDPDGDSLLLQSAMPVDGLDVRVRPDGFMSITDLGTGPTGERAIPVVVTDGRATTTGSVKISVKPRGNQSPAPIPDHVQVVQGKTVTVSPLINDLDPNGDPLMLTSVGKPLAGEQIVMDPKRGTFTYSSQTPGTVYITYTVSDGPSAAESWVRIDVIPATANQDPPVADNDIAMLPISGVVLIDALANDYDPSGGVLVIQSVSVPPSAKYAVEIIDRFRLRLSAPAGLENQVTFSYTISNGIATATGQITVIPMAKDAKLYPPIAVNDLATVRASDIVSVPVLANDSSPNGLQLAVDEKITLDDPKAGVAFVSGDKLRFRANAQYSGTCRITYTARDTEGNFTSADVIIQVMPLAEKNTSPQPLPVTSRAIAGSQIRIFVPLDGVDPNGDSVSIVGISTPPTKGTATIGSGFITYTAPKDAKGTDTFSYVVQDPFGATGVGTVFVGIASPPAVNQPPIAVPDHIMVRPSRVVDVPVLANDFDPDGDPVVLVDQPIIPADSTTKAPATVEGNTVQVQTPEQPGMLRYYVTVTDGKGTESQGTLTVEVTPEAPLRAPLARDDIMTVTDIRDGQVDVDVLANDDDPDGTVSKLKVATEDAEATVTDKSHILVTIMERRQVIVYSLTDPDGLVAKAAIVVPGLNEIRPTQIVGKSPVHVKSGETLTIPLSEYVKVRDGRKPILTFENKVIVGPGSNGAPLVKDRSTMQFTSAKGFEGMTSITYEVTDGTSPDDANGQLATLVLVIIVDPSGKHQPVATPSQISVAAGEPAVSTDLHSMVSDVDPGENAKLTFTQGKVDGPFQIKLNRDGTLSAATDSATAPGTTGAVQVTVSDGSSDPVTFTVPLVATASTRARMTTTVATMEGQAGKPLSVDLTKYVTNPFADQGKPITVNGMPTVTAGLGSAGVDGQTIIVTPAQGFHGQLNVSYTVLDATGQVSRAATGQITVNVKDRPDAPTGVRAVSNASKSATVTWTSGANNGSPITDFIVKWSGGQKSCGAVTSCQITGLTNGTAYTFTVVAVNAVGTSDPSAATAPVTPDTKPNKPLPPTCTPGDKKIDIAWVPPVNEGTAITAYNLVISGPGITGANSAKSVAGGVTSTSFAGLTNGGAYSVKVQAKNTSDMVSDFSEFSAACIPYGVPFAPASVVASTAPATTLPPSVSVSWKVPGDNGNAIQQYQVTNSAGQVVWTGTGTTAQFTTAMATADQTYTVKAKNAAGWGAPSAASNAIRAFQAPGPVTSLAAQPTGANDACVISFGAAAGNGALPGEISYHWTIGSQSGVLASGATVAAFANGRDTTVSVYALSTVKGQTSQGPVTSTTCNSYGPPGAPATSAAGGYQKVTVNWDGNGRENGRPLSSVQISVNGGAWENVSFAGSRDIATGVDAQACVRARVVDATGAVGGESSACANANRGPLIEMTPVKRTGDVCPRGMTTVCYQYYLKMQYFEPNRTYVCTVHGEGGYPTWRRNLTTDGNGYWYGLTDVWSVDGRKFEHEQETCSP